MAHTVEPSDKYPIPINMDQSAPEPVVFNGMEVASSQPQSQQQPQGGYYYGTGPGWREYQDKSHLQPQSAISAQTATGSTTDLSPQSQSGYPPPSSSHYNGGGGYFPPPQQQQQHPGSSDQRRILDLRVRTFYILVVILVMILAGAIGGGIAGGLAAANKTNKSLSETDSSSSSGGSSSSPTGTSLSSSPSTSTSSSSSSAAAAATSRTPNSILPPPTDSCPEQNLSIVQSLNGTGQPWSLSREDPTPQKFQVHCDRDMSADIRKGTIDIMRLSVGTLEECIAACAGYNFQYNNNAVYGAGKSSAGKCRAVTLVKKSGDYCFLKNGSRFDVVQSQPWLFSSAILVE